MLERSLAGPMPEPFHTVWFVCKLLVMNNLSLLHLVLDDGFSFFTAKPCLIFEMKIIPSMVRLNLPNRSPLRYSCG